MPIYEYRCQSCGHKLDTIQKMSDAPLTECPQCKQPELRRLVSAPSFRLKGGGWYETDFKSDKDKRRNLAGDGASSSSSAGGSSADSGGGDSGGKTADSAPKTDGAPKSSSEATA